MTNSRLSVPIWSVAAFVALITSACAPVTQAPTVSSAEEAAEQREQKKLVLKRRLRDIGRLQNAGFPIVRDAVSLCKDDTTNAYGFYAMTEDQFESELRDLAKEEFGLGKAPRIMFVADDSPAAQAGLRVGDVVKTVNGMTLTSASTGAAYFQPDQRERLTELMKDTGQKAVTLSMLRGVDSVTAEEVELDMAPVKVCDYQFALQPSDAVNAAADGKRIIVTTGMLRFVETDAELDTVLAHELAHNAMGHLDSRKVNTAIGGAAGLALDILAAAAGVNTGAGFMKLGMQAGGGAFSQSFEAEADYVGLYILAKSEKKYQESADFWRRMATISPKSIEHATTHPTTAARFVALKKGIAEIDGKKTSGTPLEPEKKTFDLAQPGTGDANEALGDADR